ncbi:MAG: hypothetical protein WCO56_21530 [Verrucomicrobiota bacterium]
MKNSTKKILQICSILTVVTVGAVFSAKYNYAKHPATPLATLGQTSVVELPDVAARLVLNASAENRATVAREVLQATASLSKPGVLPFVVSAICRSVPEVAAVVATSAVQLQSSEAAACIRAAVSSAPDRANQIVFALCQQYPGSYNFIATIAAEQAGSQARSILDAVAAAIPEFQPYLQQALALNGDEPLNVSTTLAQISQMAVVAAREQSQVSQRKAVETVIASQDNTSSYAPSATAVKPTVVRATLAAATVPNFEAQARARIAQAEQIVAAPLASTSVGPSPYTLNATPVGQRYLAPRVAPPYTPVIPTNVISGTNTKPVNPGGVDYSAP